MASTMAGLRPTQDGGHRPPYRKNPSFPDGHSHSNDRDDWEDWSDEDPYKTDGGEDLLVVLEDAEGLSSPRSRKPPLPSRKSSVLLPENSYAGSSGPARLKSRARQKAQNTQAGIKVVTDMTKFRKQQQQMKLSAEADPRHGQFADLAALQALEGDQSQSSVGSWHWLKKTQAAKAGGGKSRMSRLRAEGAPGSTQQDLSPSDRPIMIGIAFAADEAGSRAAGSPQSSLADTPVGWPGRNQRYLPGQRSEQAQLRSVWSPDTEDTDSPRTASGLSPQRGHGGDVPRNPPMPAVPLSFRERQRLKEAQAEEEYDDNFTPVTLFEEDGSPILLRKPTTKSTKSTRSKGHARSPATSVGTPSGWWDHIRSPFIEQASITPSIEQANNNPFRPKPHNVGAEAQIDDKSADADEWWVGKDAKQDHPASAVAAQPLGIFVDAVNVKGQRTDSDQRPSSTIASSSRVSPDPPQSNGRFETGPRPDTRGSEHYQQSHAEKAKILAQENDSVAEQPPPYSPPNKQGPLKYRAVFPPGHPLSAQFPPSPGPISPGLANTMTSQGAINMTEVPLTPAADRPAALTQPRDAPLPTRAPGTYPTGDQFLAAVGNSPAARVERQRRRHEKEDVAARTVGGAWRGRGCVPASGCYGRSGREGRKRRRVWLGVCIGALIVVVLIVVLMVVLLRNKGEPAPQQSMWLNLTNYPPVPTGVLTVVGADNSETVTTCVAPSTLWSCTLPKDQQAANKPYEAEQPTFVIQIQFDNSTRQFWNVPDGTAPTFTPLATGRTVNGLEKPTETTTPGTGRQTGDLGANLSPPLNMTRRTNKRQVTERPTLTTRAAAGIRVLLGRDGGSARHPNFTPVPAPPSFQDMWFLGNTTDGIRSERKAGEATPFFISFLPSLNSSAGPNMLARRGLGSGISSFDPLVNNSAVPVDVDRLVPRPEVNADGTPAPARMVPRQVLQQPLRLFDRGLDTEHYGFYTYFNKTIYVKSLLGPTKETAPLGEVPADRDGGALASEAKNIVIWGWTRFHVQIWTRRANSTRLLSRDGRETEGMGEKQAWEVRRPGTFPYPITVREDTHGGDRDGKGTVTYNITDRGQFDLSKIGLQFNNVGAGGEWVNPRGLSFNPSYGGIDGGTGGCKCAWTNFLNLGGRTT